MKKIVLIYAAILIGFFGIFSIIDRSSDYIIEKKVWKIYRQQIDIAKDPNVIPDKNFEHVINQYKKIIEKYPNSNITPGLHIHVGEMYALQKDYERARKVFNELIRLYPSNRGLIAEALFKIGKTYEIANRWSEAYDVYAKIMSEYPLTKVGLNIPKYIADYHKKQNDFQNTMTAYEIAVRHYKKIASEHKDSRAGLSALRHLSNCYLDQNRWPEAIETMGMTLERYSTSSHLSVKSVEKIIKTINITAAYKLKDYDVAIRLYEGIIARNPGHPLVDYLKRVIDAFNQLKEKGIQVSDRK